MIEVRCAKCGTFKEFKNLENPKDEGVSHGYCKTCYELELIQMEEDLKWIENRSRL